MQLLDFAYQHSWLIVALPVLSFVLIAGMTIIAGKGQELARATAPGIIILCMAAALVIAGGALVATLQHAPHPAAVAHEAEGGHHAEAAAPLLSAWKCDEVDWLAPEPTRVVSMPGDILEGIREWAPTLRVGVLLDPLSTAMLFTVVLVSLLVQIYSVGYMKREEHPRFFLYMSLFTASMLGMVIASNLVQMFIFWELVGLCSYLLIGFWFPKPEAARAAIKAFIVTRFGDLGLLIAVIALWLGNGDMSFVSLQAAVANHTLVAPLSLSAIAILIFIGASGKSAQFPLHIWLPDAMKGPTSVSALIHAATMVAAGVFLVARMHFIFEAAPDALLIVALIGGFTALFAASIGLAQNDMKKVMAYSTISQLGYMMMGLGLAAPAAAFFHLTTHAFFKALLFLTAGSVIHAVHTQDIREMGGLFGKMKITAITCLIGGLALAGIVPLAGFFSKDKLLEAAWEVATRTGEHSAAWEGISPAVGWLILLMALVTVLMTAFYTTRMWTLVFLGKPRTHGAEHAHESPATMTFSLTVLAILTCVTGFLFIPGLTGMQWARTNGFILSPVGIIGLLLALGGIAWAYRLYAKAPAQEPLLRLGWAYAGMSNLWWVNSFFVWLAGRVVLVMGLLTAKFDKTVIDGGLVDGTAWLTGRLGQVFRRVGAGPTPGQLQYYALVIFVVAALVLAAMMSGVTGLAPLGVMGR
jgi:NADH-quinone oxidoreductase subunit L